MARQIKHGMSHTPTYTSWRSMHNRCNNPNTDGYDNYGGRGITMQEDWKDFMCFLRDMGVRPEGLTLDRKDTDGNYTAGNCRWATLSEQQQNKRPFTQPPGKTYGAGECRDCSTEFTKLSSRAVRCPPCLTHARRYHRNG